MKTYTPPIPPFLRTLPVLLLLSLWTSSSFAQQECVVIIQGAEKPASGNIPAENFARNTTDKMIAGLSELTNPQPVITVLRPAGAGGALPRNTPARTEQSYANKTQLLNQLKNALCNKNCDDILIMTLGHGMEDTLSSDSVRRINGGLWLGNAGGRWDEFLLAPEIARIIDSCQVNVKVYANHCFSQAMIDGIRHYLQDPSRLRIGVASSQYNETSEFKGTADQYYDFSRYFLENYYTILTNPEAMKKLREEAEKLKVLIEADNRKIEEKRKEIEKKIREKEAEIKSKEAQIQNMEKALEAAREKEKEADQKRAEQINLAKANLELLSKRIELVEQKESLREKIKTLKGRANRAEKKRQEEILKGITKELSENGKELSKNKVKSPTSNNTKLIRKKMEEEKARLKKLEEEQTTKNLEREQKQKEIDQKKDELSRLKQDLEVLKKQLDATALKKVRAPVLELLLSEAFKSAQSKTKSSHAQRNGPVGSGISIPLPEKPFTRLAIYEKKTNTAGKPDFEQGKYIFNFYKIEVVENGRKKCRLIGWVSDKFGMPVAAIKTDTCTIDCRITRFSFTDASGTHRVSIDTDAKGEMIITVDDQKKIPGVQYDGTPLQIPGNAPITAHIGFTPDKTVPSVYVKDWKVSNVQYDPKTGTLTFEIEKDGKKHRVRIRYKAHGEKEITIDNQHPYTETMAMRSSLVDPLGVRIGELGMINENGILSGTLWLEYYNQAYPVTGWYDSISTLFLAKVVTPDGQLMFSKSAGEAYWQQGLDKNTLQPVLQNVASIQNAQVSIRFVNGKPQVILAWELDSTAINPTDLEALSSVRILKYSGNNQTPTVIELPANARTYVDPAVFSGMTYSYHLMTGSENLYESECGLCTPDYPVFSYPEILRVEKKDLKRKDSPNILEITGGALTATGAILYVRSLGDEDQPPAKPVAFDDQIELNCYDELIIDLLANDSGEGIRLVSVTAPSGVSIEISSESQITVVDPGLSSFTFDYVIEDVAGQVATASVQVIVLLPVVETQNDWYETPEGVAFSGNVLNNDTGSELLVVDFQEPAQGTLSFEPDGSFTLAPEPGFCDPLVLTYTVADICGQEATATVTLEILDETAPVWDDAPADITVECDSIPDSPTPEVSDNCTAEPAITFEEESNGGTWPYTITRTWSVSDEAGNATVYQQLLTVEDTKAPEFINFPSDTLVNCDAIPGPFTPQITDNCTNSPTITFEEEINAGQWPYTITRTWTLTDEAGNSATAQQVLTVQDTVAPVLTGPTEDITVDCADFPEIPIVEASDNCSDSIPIQFTEEVVPGCPILVIRTWSVMDEAGNTQTEVQTITIFDVTAPVIICPDDVSVQCGDPIDPAITGMALAADDCTPVNLSYLDSSFDPCPGDITRVWTAIDECGNVATCEQIILQYDVGCDFNPVVTVENPVCGLENGVITVEPSEPGEYEFFWSIGETGPTITQIPPGLYSVVVFNLDLDCSQTLEILVEEEQLPLVLIDFTDPVGGNNGSITLEIANPSVIPPFDIYLNGSLAGQAQDNQFKITGLGPGSYDVFVVNTTGCTSNTVSIVFVMAGQPPENRNQSGIPGISFQPSGTHLFADDLLDVPVSAALDQLQLLGVEHPKVADEYSAKWNQVVLQASAPVMLAPALEGRAGLLGIQGRGFLQGGEGSADWTIQTITRDLVWDVSLRQVAPIGNGQLYAGAGLQGLLRFVETNTIQVKDATGLISTATLEGTPADEPEWKPYFLAGLRPQLGSHIWLDLHCRLEARYTSKGIRLLKPFRPITQASVMFEFPLKKE